MNQINEMSIRSKITIVVDENLFMLKSSLEKFGFKVLTVRQGAKDDEIAENLTGRALLTKNVRDFKLDAVIHDFDIIDISNINFIDNEQDRSNKTSRIISDAIRKSEFYNKRGNWNLIIKNDGTYNLNELK
jgi:hypothetical protein